MSTSNNAKQRKSRVPSRRDQEIYTRVVVHCDLQYQVAQDLGLSPGRISQILTRVRRWLAVGQTFLSATSSNPNTDAALDTTFSAIEQQRLQRQLAQSRHEYLYEISIRGIKHMSENPKHTTIRTEQKIDSDDSEIQNPKSKIQNNDGGNTVTRRIVTVRDQPLNVQLIKTAQRSAIELQRLAELDPLPPPEIAASEDRRTMAADLVTELLDDAVASDRVRSVGWDTERDFVEDLFKFLLGERHRGLATNIIAADAKHGRLRSGKNAYPGHDPMRATSGSPLDVGCVESAPEDVTHHAPDAALNKAKHQPTGANATNDQKPAESLAPTLSPTATSNQRAGQRPILTPSETLSKKSPNFSAPVPSPNTVRLICPVVINPP